MITMEPNGSLFCELASDVKRVEELRGRAVYVAPANVRSPQFWQGLSDSSLGKKVAELAADSDRAFCDYFDARKREDELEICGGTNRMTSIRAVRIMRLRAEADWLQALSEEEYARREVSLRETIGRRSRKCT